MLRNLQILQQPHFKKEDIGIRLQAYEDIINLLLFWQRNGFILKVGNLEMREK